MEKKKKTKNKKRFTWVNLAQLLTVAAVSYTHLTLPTT